MTRHLQRLRRPLLEFLAAPVLIVAGSLFTVTSITFSILLLAVQQGAAVLNSPIVDHDLRRGSNRGWFGFFVGVSLFVLITLAQTTRTSSPVFGVAIPTLAGAVAAALPTADQRDVANDAGRSLHHIATIGWTATSTARSDRPAAARVLSLAAWSWPDHLPKRVPCSAAAQAAATCRALGLATIAAELAQALEWLQEPGHPPEPAEGWA